MVNGNQIAQLQQQNYIIILRKVIQKKGLALVSTC